MSLRRNISLVVIFLLMIVGLAGSISVEAEDLTPDEIMQRVDENEYLESARMEAKMTIKNRGREMVKEMTTYLQGEDSLTEFTNPRDRGTRYLKLGDELWMYFPDAEDLVRISGHMMREGMMGSDLSYEDAVESQQLSEFHDFELKEQESIADRDAYVILATAKEGADVSYYERKIWVDQQRFVILKAEYYSTSGRLLKTMETEEIKEFSNGRFFPVKMVMNDQLKDDSSTTFEMLELDFDYDIPEGKISLDTLH